jgi:hypothetical protein
MSAHTESWNRYAYVGNNPLAYVDPLGLDDEDDTWDTYSIGGGWGGWVLGGCSYGSDGAGFPEENCGPFTIYLPVGVGVNGGGGGGKAGAGNGQGGGSSNPPPGGEPPTTGPIWSEQIPIYGGPINPYQSILG